MTILQRDTIMICPHCGRQPDGDDAPVQDFAVHGKTGEASRCVTDCGSCDGSFVVEAQTDGTFVVTKN